ncbi:MAG: metallophosphoesterase family protein [Bacteroidetes bacterium]|nr:metallophosphoesterase family protein [Bacteroidota bacterium]
MRIAIISDIHANFQALSAVLQDITSQLVDRIVCLGDIVGYGADPAACVDLVRDRAAFSVLGNHDAAVLSPHQRSYFNPTALEAVRWTADQIGSAQADWLRQLPYRVSFENMLFVHSAPRAPEEWDYVFSGMEARMQGRHFFERLCFIGHSHIPGVYSLESDLREYTPDHRYLINVGSVGQPRDGDPRSSYGLIDTVAGTYENRRISYDVDAAMRAILDRGLPPRLAHRLKSGA